MAGVPFNPWLMGVAGLRITTGKSNIARNHVMRTERAGAATQYENKHNGSAGKSQAARISIKNDLFNHFGHEVLYEMFVYI
jgi:hypothetical protein